MSFFREEGTIIGRKYKIANKIGSGSFGVVYKGINIRSNELVAIKIESLSGDSLPSGIDSLKKLLLENDYTGYIRIVFYRGVNFHCIKTK